MTKFIFFCMAIVALSFTAVPVFTGISKEREAIIISAAETEAQNATPSVENLTEVASQDVEFDAAQLNDIAPAAGNNRSDSFSSGFRRIEDSALENAPEFNIE